MIQYIFIVFILSVATAIGTGLLLVITYLYLRCNHIMMDYVIYLMELENEEED